jgi:hypothetical protein
MPTHRALLPHAHTTRRFSERKFPCPLACLFVASLSHLCRCARCPSSRARRALSHFISLFLSLSRPRSLSRSLCLVLSIPPSPFSLSCGSGREQAVRVLVKALEGKGQGATRDGAQSQESRESPFEAVFVTRRSWRREVCTHRLLTDRHSRERDMSQQDVWPLRHRRGCGLTLRQTRASPSPPGCGVAISRGLHFPKQRERRGKRFVKTRALMRAVHRLWVRGGQGRRAFHCLPSQWRYSRARSA